MPPRGEIVQQGFRHEMGVHVDIQDPSPRWPVIVIRDRHRVWK
jgi:hypothetical protein